MSFGSPLPNAGEGLGVGRLHAFYANRFKLASRRYSKERFVIRISSCLECHF